jgi:membrane-associated phospholipid phosphatase
MCTTRPLFFRATATLLLSSLIAIAPMTTSAAAQSEPSASRGVGTILLDDGKFLLDSLQMDFVDIVTAPLHIADEDSVLRSPRFYLTVVGVGAVWGVSFALDQTLRSHLHEMSASDADLLQEISYASIAGGSALAYGYGVASDDTPVRQSVLTGGEGAAVATVFNAGVVKPAFGRLRPREDDHSHAAFFRGGTSFVSGEVTPVFSLAAGISDAFDNKWYIAAPAYALALLDGFGRMGHDAHWFSDVVGAGMLGWGTTELFQYLHRRQAMEGDRWRIFPIAGPSQTASGSAGMGGEIVIARSW